MHMAGVGGQLMSRFGPRSPFIGATGADAAYRVSAKCSA